MEVDEFGFVKSVIVAEIAQVIASKNNEETWRYTLCS